MILTDERGRWIRFNRAAEEFIGYQREEILGQTAHEVPAEYEYYRNPLWG